MILLDTDACSLLIRGASKRIEREIRELPTREVCISAVTRAEVLYGIARRPEARRLHASVHAFLARVRSIAWSNEAAAHYAEIRATLEARGEPIANLDLMIAAHARSLETPLVTGNSRHFSRIPGLVLLDWGR